MGASSNLPSLGSRQSNGYQDTHFGLNQSQTVGNKSSIPGDIFTNSELETWYLGGVTGVFRGTSDNGGGSIRQSVVDFGPENYSSKDGGGAYDTLHQTPIWVHNYPRGKTQRYTCDNDDDTIDLAKICLGQDGFNDHPTASRWFPLG